MLCARSAYFFTTLYEMLICFAYTSQSVFYHHQVSYYTLLRYLAVVFFLSLSSLHLATLSHPFCPDGRFHSPFLTHAPLNHIVHVYIAGKVLCFLLQLLLLSSLLLLLLLPLYLPADLTSTGKWVRRKHKKRNITEKLVPGFTFWMHLCFQICVYLMHTED